MKKEIFAGGAGFTAFSSVPLVADDVNAYEIVYTAPEDLSGTTFEITALRADGEKIVDSGEVSGSTARYLMKNSMHAVVGDLRVRLSVLDASGACLTTKELVFEVIEGNGTGDVTADTNYPILTELIVDMRKAISDSEAVLNDLQGEISDLHSYADGKADAALASAKGYADTKDGENLTAAKTYADTKSTSAEENAKTYGKQTFAGALKGEKLGGIVRLDDVSALDRRLDTVVSSKNIIPFPYVDGMSKTVNGVTFTVSDDGSITVSGTATSDVMIVLANNLYLEKGSYMLSGMPQIELSGKNNGGALFLFEKSNEKFHLDYSAGTIVNIEQSGYVAANIKIYAGASVENVVVKPMLECGTSSTAYTKHVSDLSGVSVKKYGKNLFHCYGVSAGAISSPSAACALSNTYGTTIDKTALSSASDVLTVTQAEHPNSTNLSSYTNGFFCIGLSDMVVGQNYTLSFTFNKTDDPLSAMTGFKLQAYLNGSKLVSWQKVSANRFSLSFTWEVSGTRPDARYIEVRLSGMSGTFSAFQLEPLSTVSAYVPWSAPTTYTAGTDGTVQNLSAYEDVTTLATDNEGTVLKTKYSRDLNAAFTEIQNAIIALGGSF